MVPTISGRIQTRLFLLSFVGSLVTLFITPMLAMPGPMTEVYRATFTILAAVAVIGVGWEVVYHLLMQWRWEKDWPIVLGLVTMVPEGLLLWWALQRGMVPGIDGLVPLTAFVIHFGSVWVAVWLVANGPMRVPFVHWRFRGGRLL